VPQLVVLLPSKLEALTSNLSTIKKKKKRKKEKRKRKQPVVQVITCRVVIENSAKPSI
jgi:hypothetical protein